MFVCLLVLRRKVPVNNFSVMSGRSHRSWVINQYFRGVKCLAQGHNTAAVGIEPPTSRSGVRHSTTGPPRSPRESCVGQGFSITKARGTFLLIKKLPFQREMRKHTCLKIQMIMRLVGRGKNRIGSLEVV